MSSLVHLVIATNSRLVARRNVRPMPSWAGNAVAWSMTAAITLAVVVGGLAAWFRG